MADEKTRIESEYDFKAKGIDDLTKKVDKLTTSLGKTANATDKILKNFEELSKIDASRIYYTGIEKNQTQIKGRGVSVTYAHDSKDSREDSESIRKKIDEQLQIQLEILQKQNDDLKRQQEDDHKRAQAYYNMSQTAALRAPSKNAYESTLIEKFNLKKPLLQLQHDHPEWFISNSHNPKYQRARSLQELGGVVSSYGTGGRIAGDIMGLVGSALISPANLGREALTKLGKALGDFTSTAIQSYSDIEAIKTNISVVYGSQAQSDLAFGEIAQYAVKSPFGVKETSDMAILLKQSGVYASDLMNTLKMIGDTAGGNMEKMKRIANNYAQIQAIGKASMLDMRQFAYAGIPVFEAVSKELGVSQQQLRKLISDGKVTSDIIEKVFKDLTGINGVFENATEKGAKTLKARLQNLKDAKQLMMAGFGENIVNKGSYSGGDSLILNGVSFVESVYSGLQKWIDGRNLENDIKEIRNRNNNIEQLQRLIEYSKSQNNKDAVKVFEEALKKELSNSSLDTDRAVYYRAYRAKTESYNSMISNGYITAETNEYDIKNKLEEARMEVDRFNNNFDFLIEDYMEKNDASYSQAINFITLQKQAANDVYNLYSDILKAIKTNASLTKEELQAYKEMLVINNQQNIFDTSSKMAQKTGSAFNTVSEIKQAIAETDEAKQEEQKEREKRWKEVIELMQSMQKSLDKNGIVDLSKLSYEEFSKYLESGAIEASRKLTVTNTENKDLLSKDVPILKKQFAYVQKEISKNLSGELKGQFNSIYKRAFVNIDKLTDEEFLNKYQSVMREQTGMLKDNPGLLNLLNAASILWEGDTSDLSKATFSSKSGKEDEYIPLWKRILGSATGISPNVITTTKDTLKWYSEDMAIRNRTSGTLAAMLNGGAGVFAVQDLLKTSGILAQLRGDTKNVYQIDWAETQKAIKNFSTQLSASTEVISAYKKGLQDELNTYKSLLSNGITSAETQDLANAKTVSKEKLDKLQKVYGDQLVNAFGEIMEVNGVKVSYKDGKFVDENNKEYDVKQVKLTGNIFKILEEKLPQIYQELIAAEKANQNNKVLNGLFSNTNNTRLISQMFAGSSMSANAMNMILSNPEYVSENLNAMIQRSISDPRSNRYRFASVNEVLQAAQSDTTGKGNMARSWIREYFTEIAESAELLVKNPYYQQLLDDQKKQEKTSDLNSTIAWINDASNKTPMKGWGSNDVNPYHTNGLEGVMQRLIAGNAMKYVGIADTSTIEEISDAMSGAERGTEKWNAALEKVKSTIGKEGIVKSLEDMALSLEDIAKNTAKQAFTAPFEAMGEALVSSADASELTASKLKTIGAQMVQSVGSAMANAGFNIAAMAAIQGKLPLALAGLSLAAAGGFASGLGGALNNASKDKNNTDEQLSKLEDLKGQLVDLLQQARDDALYYENNLRHKTALDINRQVSKTSVHDALINTNGRVITTDPKDYLIATKNPRALVNNSPTVQPVINNIIHNNAGVQVRQEQNVLPDGTINIETFLENAMEQFIASPRSDNAFLARQARASGNRNIM